MNLAGFLLVVRAHPKGDSGHENNNRRDDPLSAGQNTEKYMDVFFQQVINGLVMGSMYALVAL
ncbi:MAG: hypothetical protein AAB176_07545, partial [Pseudomonadota bacterium]